ncbi:MAG TPA: hypothetical protein PKX94_06105 [Opitutales bacterium]|nr:hypothetical protein [Opitutales bacterium]
MGFFRCRRQIGSSFSNRTDGLCQFACCVLAGVSNHQATYAQIHTTYASGRLESVDDSAWADRYRKPQVWMNLSMDHKPTDSWRVFLNIKNILEEDNHIHHTDARRLSYYEFQARTYEIGLKWSI